MGLTNASNRIVIDGSYSQQFIVGGEADPFQKNLFHT